MPSTPGPGDRVVVRFRKGAGAPGDWRRDPSATASDVTGVLVASSPVELVVTRDGERVRIPRALVMSVRVLSDRPVRNSEIRALQDAAAHGWPGTEREMVGGWLARAGGGYSHRANSATPLQRGATIDSDIAVALRAWYAERDLPAIITAVERLTPTTHIGADQAVLPSVMMTRGVDPTPAEPATLDDPTSRRATAVVIDDIPSSAWVEAVLAERSTPPTVDVGRAVLTAVVDGSVGFASVVDADGLASVGRGVVTSDPTGTRWIGISCLWTAPRLRGHGVGTAVLESLVRWGAERDADHAYLQVEQDNLDAIRLYRRLGFVRHHTYGYVAL